MGNTASNGITLNTGEDLRGGNEFEIETIVGDSKRKRVDKHTDLGGNGPVIQFVNMSQIGPKNMIEAGHVLQARLDK